MKTKLFSLMLACMFIFNSFAFANNFVKPKKCASVCAMKSLSHVKGTIIKISTKRPAKSNIEGACKIVLDKLASLGD